MASVLFYAIVMYVAFVFIHPELDPLYRYGREYAVGLAGWLMKLAFFVWAGGLAAPTYSMAKGLDAQSRSIAALPSLQLVRSVFFWLVYLIPIYRS